MDDIIIDEEPLLETYIPERMFHRDGQRDALVSCLKPVLSGKKALNAFLYGPTGTGKTALTRMVIEQLKGETSKVKIVYSNCWQKSTHALLIEILRDMGEFLTGKESVDELFERMNRHSGVLALDEVDQLPPESFYRLVRSHFSLVCISNDPNALAELDYRVKSSLTVEPIEFPMYKSEEILDILKDRIQFALRPNSISKSLLRRISENSFGDARIALATLRTAALRAEDKGKIGEEDVESALKSSRFVKKEMKTETLNQHQKALMKLVKGNSFTSRELFEKYKSSVENPVGERMYRVYVKDLIEKGLIKEEGKGRWRILS